MIYGSRAISSMPKSCAPRVAAVPRSSNSSTTRWTRSRACARDSCRISRSCPARAFSTGSSQPCSRRSAPRGPIPPAPPFCATLSRKRRNPGSSPASSSATTLSAASRSPLQPRRGGPEMADELAFLTIAEAARLIEQKRLSPVELTTALIRRAEALDPQLNAYLLPTADRALDQARQAEQEIIAGGYRGPMHGIPFALKDIYTTAGIRTTGHSRICLDTVPSTDATTVRKLYEAGA